jgi:hypothetical protein
MNDYKANTNHTYINAGMTNEITAMTTNMSTRIATELAALITT